MTSVPDRIRWYDDMLVTTQHADALAARLEALVQALPGRYHPFPWGIVQADVAVVDQAVSVKRLDAVMPGGIPVAVGDDGPALDLDLRPFLTPGRRRTLLVHLAAAIDDKDARPSTRFVPDGTGAIVGDDAMPAERRRRRLALFAGDAPPETAYASFPLIEVDTLRATPAATDFVPPLLHVGPPWPLAARCAAVAGHVRAELATLVNGSQPDAAAARAQLAPVIAALLPYEVLIASQPHPFTLYLELCRVAAALAGVRTRGVPLPYPAYQHNDARAAFDPVLRFVLGEADAAPTTTLRPFVFDREGPCFRLRPDRGWTGALGSDSADLILAMDGVDSDAQAERWGSQSVIASRGAIRSLLVRRVLGVPRRRVAPPPGLLVDADVYLFRIEPDAELINAGEDLIVLSDLPGITPAALNLYVVRRGGADSDDARS
jgi:predicted component of type VI protein secretion system